MNTVARPAPFVRPTLPVPRQDAPLFNGWGPRI